MTGRASGSKALTTAQILDLPAVVPVYPVVGQVFQIGKTALYELAARDELPVPVIKVGRLLRARRADILRAIGLEDGDGAGAATPAPSVERTTSISK